LECECDWHPATTTARAPRASKDRNGFIRSTVGIRMEKRIE